MVRLMVRIVAIVVFLVGLVMFIRTSQAWPWYALIFGSGLVFGGSFARMKR